MTETQNVERREALAYETAARARAAQAEAEAKSAQAARLHYRAPAHQGAAAASRDQLGEQFTHADRIDPSVRTADDRPVDQDQNRDTREREEGRLGEQAP